MSSVNNLYCSECRNDVDFLELNIRGYITNFKARPSCTVTNVTPYEKVGIFCADCFDEGCYVQVGEFLPAHIIEKTIYNEEKRRLQLV
ncbi:hypothetical protein [Dethiobacter alkaliphilus]|uniref:Uncharacterized protein n=1 Tax=Dethiobacter alkaliphilus AHT 1 TaxID=555088 RepID=C0GE68_DETAL|nr:hypothetical protein [Dethiobacter alkaliphilus]EEG78362.1 hypothetical protein DealDRAFT_0777 [Dethiobacter alkaliphilus AHT 1]